MSYVTLQYDLDFIYKNSTGEKQIVRIQKGECNLEQPYKRWKFPSYPMTAAQSRERAEYFVASREVSNYFIFQSNHSRVTEFQDLNQRR